MRCTDVADASQRAAARRSAGTAAGVLSQASRPAIGISTLPSVLRIASVRRITGVRLSAILATGTLAGAARANVIAVRQVGGYCRRTDSNRMSVGWISRRNVTDGHFMACVARGRII